MKSKKAAIEVQFNWVFVMIAGALILTFFFGFAQKQRELSQTRLSDTLITNLESISTGAAVSAGTVQSVEIPNVGISFDCTEECLCTYSVGSLQKYYNDKIIFAPHQVESQQLVLWTLDWNAPFRAANFVFATTADEKYYILYDNEQSPVKLMLESIIPEEVNAEFVKKENYESIGYDGHNSVKFVFAGFEPSGTDLGIDSSFKRQDVSAVKIMPGGVLSFYDKTSSRELDFDEKQIAYFKEPMALGAVFAADYDMYMCNSASAIRRLGKVAEVSMERISQIQTGGCTYDTSPLLSIIQNADLITGNQDPTKIILDIAGYAVDLSQQNSNALMSSCPLIY